MSDRDRDSVSLTEDGREHGPDGYDAAARSKSSLREILDRGLTSLTVGLGVIGVGLGILVLVANLNFQTVTGGSMRPTVSPGDLAITWSVPVGSPKVSDVIAFYPPTRPDAVMHRIVSVLGRRQLARQAHRQDRLPDGDRRALPRMFAQATATGAHRRLSAHRPGQPARVENRGGGQGEEDPALGLGPEPHSAS